MLVFAHTGITIGCIWLAGKAWPSREKYTATQKSQFPGNSTESYNQPETQTGHSSTIKGYLLNTDYRLLLFGSMLPDIIDKPLGIFLLSEEISSGRIYGHTLLFLLLIAGAGMAQYLKKGQVHLLTVAFGIFSHLVLDKMWQSPQTLLWPIHGFQFEKHPTEDWLPNIFENLVTNPGVYIPEIIGALILAAFMLNLIRKGKVATFLKTGRAN